MFASVKNLSELTTDTLCWPRAVCSVEMGQRSLISEGSGPPRDWQVRSEEGDPEYKRVGPGMWLSHSVVGVWASWRR